jgi:hypothetical protein
MYFIRIPVCLGSLCKGIEAKRREEKRILLANGPVHFARMTSVMILTAKLYLTLQRISPNDYSHTW